LNVRGDFALRRSTGTTALVTNGGTIVVQGDVTVGVGANGGTTVVQFANTGQDQTIASTGGLLPTIEVANGTRTVHATAGTADLAMRGLVLTSGTFVAPVSTLSIKNDLTQTGGAFAAGIGTVRFDNSSTSSVTQNINPNGALPGSLNFHHLVFAGSGASTKTFSIGTGDTLYVAGDLTLQRTSGTPLLVANGGAVAVQGNVTVGAGANGGTTVVQFANTSADQTYTSTGGVLSSVEVVNGTHTVSAAAGTTNLAVRSLTLTSGIFAAPAETLTVTNDLTQTGGAFDAGTTGKLLFSNCTSLTHNINVNGATGGLLTVNDLTLSGTAGTQTYTFGTGDGLFVEGDFVAEAASGTTTIVKVNGGTIDVAGSTTLGAGYQAGTPAPSYHSPAAGTGVVSGTVFNDLNGDGQKQGNGPGLSGWTVELVDSNSQVIASTQSGSSGAYSFLDLAPGSYTVQQSPTRTATTASPTWGRCLPAPRMSS
jgi:hypothetical protein